MAVNVSLLTAAPGGAAAASVSTASVSPAAGSMVVLYLTWAVSGGSATPTITGLSGTWVNKASTPTGGSSSTKIGVWTCTDFSGSGAILITFASGLNTCCWSVLQVTGANNAATPVQVPITSKTVTSLAADCTYAAAASAANLFLYGCAGPGFFTQVPNESGTLWTELSDNSQATPSCSLEVQVSPDVTNLTGASTLSATSVDSTVGFEIAAAGGILPLLAAQPGPTWRRYFRRLYGNRFQPAPPDTGLAPGQRHMTGPGQASEAPSTRATFGG